MRKKPTTWNGVTYPSIAAAARACGMAPRMMLGRIKKGYTCDDDVRPTRIPCIWNGVKYPSLTAAAKKLGITREAMRKRIEKGYTRDNDLRKAGRPRKNSYEQ